MALPALAIFDVNDVPLGASEKQVKQRFRHANCRPLEWPTKAADRRCDDSRVKFYDIDASVTFYLKNDAVEGFDVRFEKRDLERMTKVLLERYGHAAAGSGAITLEWKAGGERARLTAEKGRRRASLLVWRGAFEEEIYKVR